MPETKKMRVLFIIISILTSVSLCSQTINEVRREIARQGLPHPNIVLAQARLETGNFTSRMCKTKHNLFGIKHNGKYASYARWQDSIADYKKRISSRYKGGSYYDFLKRIGYARDPRYIRKLKQFS